MRPTVRAIPQRTHNFQASMPSLDAEREAYRNLALVRLRVLRVEVEQAINATRGREKGGYNRYDRYEPTKDEYLKSAVAKVDALIRTYEQEATDE